MLLSNYVDIKYCCISQNVIYEFDSNEYVCTNCGLVLGYSNDLFADPRMMGANNIKAIINSSRKSLDWSTLGVDSSMIGYKNVDYMNKPVNWLMAQNLRQKDKMCVNRNESNRHRRIKGAKKNIVTLSQKLNIPTYIADRAAQLYDQAYAKGLIKGRNIEGISAACLYIACREEGIVKHLDDFSNIMDTKVIKKKRNAEGKQYITKPKKRTRKQLFEFYQFLVTELNIKDRIKEQNLPAEINRVGGIIKVSERTIRKAIDISEDLRKFEQSIFFGKSPLAVASCIIYIASKLLDDEPDNIRKENIKQITVTRNSKISIVTLRKHCSKFLALLKDHCYTVPSTLNTFLE